MEVRVNIGEGVVFEDMGRFTAAPSSGKEAWRAGYAVRRDWLDGTHEFVGFRTAQPEADRFINGDRSYWRRGPVRPLAWSVVVISRRDFDLHAGRHECRSPDCPLGIEQEGLRREAA